MLALVGFLSSVSDTVTVSLSDFSHTQMIPTCMNWERAMLAFLVSRGESLYLVNIWLIVILINVSSLWINCESLVTINLSGRDIFTIQKSVWNCVMTDPQTNDIMRVFNFMVQQIVHGQRIDFKRWILVKIFFRGTTQERVSCLFKLYYTLEEESIIGKNF